MDVRLRVIGLAIMTKGLGVWLHPILTRKLEFSLISKRAVFTINLDLAMAACMLVGTLKYGRRRIYITISLFLWILLLYMMLLLINF